jgi:hypothetical protein
VGTTSPYAEDYYAAITAQNRFTEINNITAVQPGDLIAVKYLNSSVTGHMMLVDSTARAESSSSPVIAGTTQYALTVIDSSSSYHGPNDTRVTDPSTTGNGIGRGEIRIYVDASLRPVGYSWSNTSGSTYYDLSQRPLIFGRLNLAAFGVTTPPPGNVTTPPPGNVTLPPPGNVTTPPPGNTQPDPQTGAGSTGTGTEQPSQPANPQMNPDDTMSAEQMGGCSVPASSPSGAGSQGILWLLLPLAAWLGLRSFRRTARAYTRGN